MKRKALAASIVMALAVVLAGCAGSGATPVDTGPKPVKISTGPSGMEELHILMSDGRTVTCLIWIDRLNYKYGRTMSCDWDHAEGAK